MIIMAFGGTGGFGQFRPAPVATVQIEPHGAWRAVSTPVPFPSLSPRSESLSACMLRATTTRGAIITAGTITITGESQRN